MNGQRRAVAVLAELLADAERAGLPVMRWTVSPGGDLVAASPVRGAVARVEWSAWVDRLHARPWAEQVSSTGKVHLSAVAEHVLGSTRVAVLADVFPDEQPRVSRRESSGEWL